jgi:hypothetical protein
MGKDGTREERLAAALRENLKRRKQQQRGGAGESAEPERGGDGDRGNEG